MQKTRLAFKVFIKKIINDQQLVNLFSVLNFSFQQKIFLFHKKIMNLFFCRQYVFLNFFLLKFIINKEVSVFKNYVFKIIVKIRFIVVKIQFNQRFFDIIPVFS